ncbi:MAG: nickel-dependent hydrogenase large subunit [Thermoanaerobaculaceae bacterium]
MILNRNFNEVYLLDLIDPGQIREEVAHSWYRYPAEKDSLHPFEGETQPHYTGPRPPYGYLDEKSAYSWLKSPRWKGNAMEVGPLARVLVGYASGKAEFKEVVNEALARLAVPASALFSTLGRTAARGLETRLAVYWLLEEYNRLLAHLKNGNRTVANTELWEPETWPRSGKGVGFTEAPRGALAHWVHVRVARVEPLDPNDVIASPHRYFRRKYVWQWPIRTLG